MMTVEIGWRQGIDGISEVWLLNHGHWLCKLFGQEAELEAERHTIVNEWAEQSDSLAEFLEMMYLEGFIDMETLRHLLSEHAPLRRIWKQLRALCCEAGDIGDYPAMQILVVPHPFPHDRTQIVLSQEYVTEALLAWTASEAGDPGALSSPNLGLILADIGVLAGQRLGLGADQAVHFADWLVEAVTGWSVSHGNERTIVRIEDVASRAVYGDVYTRGQAFCTPDFWRAYRPAIPAVVAFLKTLP
jgi:hypothetical protein